MVQSLRSLFSRAVMQTRVSLFGNNRSWAINRRYKRYASEARRMYGSDMLARGTKAAELAASLTAKGYVRCPSPLDATAAAALRDKVDALFADPANVVQVGRGSQRLVDGIERVPEIERLVAGGLAQVAEAFFGSHFKIYLASFYRTVPDESKPESSFLWHFDNAVDEEVKVMIYLDDVIEATGALRVKDLALSNQARQLGFWHRRDYERARPLFDDDSTTQVLEGGPGTAVFFRPGRVVHKATAPRHGHRDVVTLVLIPSLIPWREHYARNRHLLSTNGGICLDPRTDQPQSIGYHF